MRLHQFLRTVAMATFVGVMVGVSSGVSADTGGKIASFAVVRKGDTLHVEAEAADASVWANTQLLIDADGDAKTGYGGAGVDHGYDVMVEGSAVYRFKGGDPAAWSWERIGVAQRNVDGKKLTIDIDLAQLPGKSATAAVVLRALSTNYQAVTATAPAAGAATVDLADAGGAGADTVGASAGSPAATAPAAGLNAAVSQDGTTLVMKITAATPADLNTLLIFFDTDENADTGFNPPADPHFGFEDMIQGGSLSQHTGAARDGWSWLTLAAVKQTTAGSTQEIRFNASLLKSSKFRWAVWQMSPDWQTRSDFFPKAGESGAGAAAGAAGAAGTAEFSLDTARLHADAGAAAADVAMAPPHANAADPARERFKAIKTYCCYYGPDRTAALSHVDAAILHIPAQTPATVAQLTQLGVVTIGYLSVGEDESLRVGNGQGPGGKASWYFDRNHTGKPEMNGTWGSYFANAADPAWRADRVAQARLLTSRDGGGWGFDGIFLDTIETVDAYPESRAGMIQLVQELRAAIPDKVIVINRGFSLLKEPAVCSNIDGLMFESFTDSYDFASKQYFRFGPSDMDATRATMVSTVLPAVKQYGLRVLALDYCEVDQTDRIQEALDRAATFGMVPAVSLISLDAVYDTWDLTPHPNPKYLQQMATPEAIRVTMDTARNGFPAGTMVQPSSCFMGYSAAAVVDGVRDRSKLDWNKAAWASAEEANAPQQLELKFPQPVMGGTLKITFAIDGGRPHPSRNFKVDVCNDAGAWTTIANPANQSAAVFSCPLPAEAIREIRITQAAGGGDAARPDLMWIGQVERVE